MALSAVLSHPALYILFVRSVGASKVGYTCLEALATSPGDRVLDIGCGPAWYLDRLPPCDYHGFDIDSRYIAYARRRFGDRGHFYDQAYTETQRAELAPFDRVMFMGLLHHLDDAECHALLDLVARSLAPGGRVVSQDTVLYEGQSRLSRFLARNDRGQYVRSPEGFLDLARQHFGTVEHHLHGDTIRTRSAHCAMVMSDPKG